jgi:predicted RNA binding protein YcfA (HicA-like mRNA interferase family)
MKPTKANITKVLNAAGFTRSQTYGGRYFFANRISRQTITPGWSYEDDSSHLRIKIMKGSSTVEQPKLMIDRMSQVLATAGIKHSSNEHSIWIQKALI